MIELRMPEINSVIIAGNLIKDPTFRSTTTGTPVTNFTIASNRKFKDSSGQIKEDVCFIGVVAWYKLAESCYENLKKGSAVLVEGELQSRSWKTEDGFSRNIVEIKARRIQFLSKREVGVAVPVGEEEEGERFDENQCSETPQSEMEPARNEEHGPDGRVPGPQDVDFGYRDLKI
ncbi:MAG: single-stranded DNA-binding protein [Calditrichaeota bacterium]|nr:single-stranded DNA-binding protein [Calditrichota bacterium]